MNEFQSGRPLDLAPFIDHTLLKASAVEADIRRLCSEARAFGFAAVCVNPLFVNAAKRFLDGSGVKTASVVGFPLGASTAAAKAFETRRAVEDGADEIDTVISLAAAKEHRYGDITAETAAVVEAAGKDVPVKVILEMCELTEEEKPAVCRAALEGGAAFLKTSTGFGRGGARAEDVRLMAAICREYGGERLPLVKAAGGIRTREEALQMIAAGASRIGTSAGTVICAPQPETRS